MAGAVRYDVDADGDLADGDAGIPGVEILLYQTDSGFTFLTNTFTDSSGGYSFTNLGTGTHLMIESDLPGYSSTADADGGSGFQASRISRVLGVSSNLVDQDFLDINLTSCADHEELAAFVIPGGVTFPVGSGVYTGSFDNAFLPYGHTVNSNWLGEVTLSYAQLDTLTDSDAFHLEGSRYTTMSDFNPGAVPTRSGKIYLVYGRGITAFGGSGLGLGSNHLWEVTYDFTGMTNGYLPAGTLIGMVDIDGISVDGESLVMSAVLDGGGNNPFLEYYDDTPNTEIGHSRGVYDPVSNTYTWNGNDSVSNDSIFMRVKENLASLTMRITQGGLGSSLSFKLVAPVIDSACIEGNVYNDTADDNTLNGTGETGVAGVAVTLYTDPNSDGDPSDGTPVGTAMTDTSGLYEFPMQPTGSYVVVETDPPSAVSDDDTQGSPTDDRVAITLDGVTASTGNDFLDDLSAVTNLFDISGTVYLDGPTNDLAFSADDIGAAGQTVYLYRDFNGDGLAQPGEQAGTTTTATNGTYTFADLPSEGYIVLQETDPTFQSVDDTEGLGTDNKIAVTLTNTNAPGNDFLDAAMGTLSGRLYIDNNRNGVEDTGDSDLGSITIEVTDAAGQVQKIESDADGDWTIFILQGSATVTVLTNDTDFPIGYFQSGGTNPNTTNVVAGTNTFGGFDGFATVTQRISGLVFEDIDGDAATLDWVGRSNVTVRYYADDGDNQPDAGDTLQGTTTTDATGGYSFVVSPSNTYWVTVDSQTFTPVNGFNPGFNLTNAWAEQTYGAAGSAAFDGTNYSFTVTNGAFYGGKQADISDDASVVSNAEHVIRVPLTVGNGVGIDFGFSYNVIVNTRDETFGAPTNLTVQGSFRQFQNNANHISGVNTSMFRIAGTGVKTIRPLEGYPFINDPIVLDGTTQPGYSGNPIIQLDGSVATGATAGLVIRTDDSVIRGFIAHSFPDEGLEVDASDGGADRNVLQNNWVGIDDTGAARPNADHGILLTDESFDNIVGGTNVNDGNVISGNGSSGVHIREAYGNVVIGNLIGLAPDGVTPVSNTTHGVQILNRFATSYSNRIGGLTRAEANTIAYNGGNGVHLQSAAGLYNPILGNLIFSNAGLGIDLNADGVTTNDTGDADSGPNNLQNYPVLTSALALATNSVTIVGSLNSAASSTFRIEFFANTTGDPSGHGEGQRFLGFADVSTDGSGNASFTQNLSGVINQGDAVTATATDPGDNTSEFGSNIIAFAELDIGVFKTVNDATPDETDLIAYTLSVTNAGPSEATGLVVTDSVPAGVTYFSDSSADYADATGLWNVGVLPAGATTSLTINATVDAGTSGTSITNVALLNAVGEPDTNAGNDSDTATITVNTIDLAVFKTADPSPAIAGGSLQYTILVTNSGPGRATGVVVNDFLPPEVTLSGFAVSQGSFDTNTAIWTVGTVSNAADATLTLTVDIDPGAQ